MPGILEVAAPARLYNFARNIWTNISTLAQHTHLKLGKLTSLFPASRDLSRRDKLKRFSLSRRERPLLAGKLLY